MSSKNTYMAGCVFLGILAVIFLVNVFIRFPFQKAISITESGVSCLETPGKQWFILESDTYVVDGMFETISIRSSSIPLFSKSYTYFNVKITSDGKTFVMPVRVRDSKAEKLKQGYSIALYGMVSRLDNSLSGKQLNTLKDSSIDRTSMCLFDNGDTVVTRIMSASVFAVLTIVCVWLAVKIYMVKPQ